VAFRQKLELVAVEGRRGRLVVEAGELWWQRLRRPLFPRNGMPAEPSEVESRFLGIDLGDRALDRALDRGVPTGRIVSGRSYRSLVSR
jgi:hypothetical protein